MHGVLNGCNLVIDVVWQFLHAKAFNFLE
jgi:hypothetical protein